MDDEIPSFCRLMLEALDRPVTEEAHDQMHAEMRAFAPQMEEAGIDFDTWASAATAAMFQTGRTPTEMFLRMMLFGAFWYQNRSEGKRLQVFAPAIPDSIHSL